MVLIASRTAQFSLSSPAQLSCSALWLPALCISPGGLLFLKVFPPSVCPVTVLLLAHLHEYILLLSISGGLWGWPVPLPWLGLTHCLAPKGCQGTEG